MPKISVIIPVFNVEKYLHKCVDSLLQQSYNDYEILLIDDGSTDDSRIIADKYAERNKLVTTYHKENGGLADARNYGIEKAKGEYITFIDSDDSVRSDYLETLIQPVDWYGADLVIAGSRVVYNEDYPININKDDKDYDIAANVIYCPITREECFRKVLIQEDIDVSACSKMYKKSIFESIRFPKGKLYEDIAIIGDVIENANRIYYSNYAGYNYLQRPGSIMYGKMDERRLSLIDSTENLIHHMHNKYPSVVPEAIHRYVYSNFHLLGRSIPYKDCDHYTSILRENILKYQEEIQTSDLYSKKEKAASYLLKFDLHIYKIFLKAYYLLKNKKIE